LIYDLRCLSSLSNPSFSKKEYARHIISLLENPQKAHEIALNGSDFVRKNYNWENETAKIEQLIDKGI